MAYSNQAGDFAGGSLTGMDIISQVELKKTVEILKKGGVVAFPTDTVYGIGASSKIESAIARIFEIKQRPRSKPLQFFLSDLSEILSVAASMSESACCLAQSFLPGGLTLILPRSSHLSEIATSGGDTVAIRIPDHPVPIALVRELGAPIVGTSANISGQPSPTTAEEVREALAGKVDLILEGTCYQARESTIVNVSSEVPRLMREGAIPREELEKVCGRVITG